MHKYRIVLVWLSFVTVASAQNFYPKKDAVFGQVVVGGGYQTIINIANRGSHEYLGTLRLFRTDEQGVSIAWNPTVNGAAVANGSYEIEIQPGSTVTLRLTGSQLQSGGAVLLSKDLLLDNLIEANLTYRVRTSGQVTDSVGISPSREFYRASLPFEKFAETALALVNGDLDLERTATVELTLFSADGTPSGNQHILTLGPFSHLARFLHEFFQGQTLDGGRVEIASDYPIFGTALTLTGGEFSSLPLEPAPVTYSVRLDAGERYATGELSFWADGSFIRGYMLISAVDGEAFEDPEFSLVNGELENGRLRLTFTILQDPFFAEEVTLTLRNDQFSFDSSVVDGEWIQLFQNDEILTGSFLLESTTPPRSNGGSARLWSKSDTGANVFAKPCNVSKVRIQGTYSGNGENFIVWFEGDSGRDLLVNEILGTGEGYSTSYSGIHRAEGCGEFVIEDSTGVSWEVTEVP